MQVTVNGEPTETTARTIAELLDALGLAGRPVAVERNASVVPKRRHAQTELAPGDRLELVTLVGGG
jgi:sulfur carrier protein